MFYVKHNGRVYSKSKRRFIEPSEVRPVDRAGFDRYRDAVRTVQRVSGIGLRAVVERVLTPAT